MQPWATFLAVVAFLAPPAARGPEPATILARGRFELARKDYSAALRTFLTLPAAADTPLGQAAREGIVAAYAHTGGPAEALLLFRRAAGDRAPAMLERLAAHYAERGQFDYSSNVYHQLTALAPTSPKACAWQVNVVHNTLIAGTKPDQMFQIQLLVVIDHAMADRPVEPKRVCDRALHDILFDLADVWTEEMTTGCTAYSWQHWPQLETLLEDVLENFPHDPRTAELRGYLARLHDLQRR